MKSGDKFILTTITLLFLYSCSQLTKPKENISDTTTQEKLEKVTIDKEYLIEEKSIEGFKTEDIYSAKSSELTYEEKLRAFQTDEGIDTMNVVSVSDKKGKLFDIVLYDKIDKRIQKIIIESDRCKTKDRISINSTLNDFTEVYSDFSIEFSYISNSFWVNTKKLNSVNFYLDSECYRGSQDGLYDSDMAIVNLKDFDKNCKISEIIIF